MLEVYCNINSLASKIDWDPYELKCHNSAQCHKSMWWVVKRILGFCFGPDHRLETEVWTKGKRICLLDDIFALLVQTVRNPSPSPLLALLASQKGHPMTAYRPIFRQHAAMPPQWNGFVCTYIRMGGFLYKKLITGGTFLQGWCLKTFDLTSLSRW